MCANFSSFIVTCTYRHKYWIGSILYLFHCLAHIMRQRPYILSAACYPSQHEHHHILDFAVHSMNNSISHARKKAKPKINPVPLLTCISARIPFTWLSISGWNVEMHKTIVTSYRCCCYWIYISIVAAANALKMWMKNKYTSFDLFVSALGSAETASTQPPSVMCERVHDSERIGRIPFACSLVSPFEISVHREYSTAEKHSDSGILWSVNEWISISGRPPIYPQKIRKDEIRFDLIEYFWMHSELVCAFWCAQKMNASFIESELIIPFDNVALMRLENRMGQQSDVFVYGWMFISIKCVQTTSKLNRKRIAFARFIEYAIDYIGHHIIIRTFPYPLMLQFISTLDHFARCVWAIWMTDR